MSLNDNVHFGRGTLSKATAAASAERQVHRSPQGNQLSHQKGGIYMSRLMDVRESICLEKTIGNTAIHIFIHIISLSHKCFLPWWYMYLTTFQSISLEKYKHHCDIQLLFRYFYWILISEQIGIIPKPELRGFWGEFPYQTTIQGDLGGLVVIICPSVCLTDLPFNHSSTWETHQNHSATVTSVVKAASPFRPLFESLGNHASVRRGNRNPVADRSHFHHFST